MTSSPPPPKAVMYHDALASAWSSGYASGGFSKRFRFIEQVLKTMVVPRSRWLDLGCGSGILARYLDRMGAVGMAVDGSGEMIMAATSEAKVASLKGFEYRRIQTVEHLDFPGAAFDGVLCSSVLEYVESPGNALDEISRLLHPSGHLLISVPNKYSFLRALQKTIRFFGRIIGKKFFSYLDVSKNAYTRKEILFELESRSLRVNTVSYFDPLLPNWVTLIIPPSLVFVHATRIDHA